MWGASGDVYSTDLMQLNTPSLASLQLLECSSLYNMYDSTGAIHTKVPKPCFFYLVGTSEKSSSLQSRCSIKDVERLAYQVEEGCA